MDYKVPFVDLPTQFKRLKGKLRPVLDDVIFKRADFIMRKDLRDFEQNMSALVGKKFTVGLNSGTDALIFGLLASGIKPGDEVITVAHSFVATMAAVEIVGAKLILVDVGKDFLMDPSLLEKTITPKTKAIIPVHLNGRVCDMDAIMKFAQKHNLIVIEDAAQALTATFNGHLAGSWGLVSCFSLYPMKNLGACGDAGLLATDSEEIAAHVKHYRDHGLNRETGIMDHFGFNSRLDNLQAAILKVKMKFLPKYIEWRRKIARLYNDGLKDLPGVTPPPPPENGNRFDTFQHYIIRTKDRDRLNTHLAEAGIETMIFWKTPWHKQPNLNLSHWNLPETESISREVIALPMNSELSVKQVGIVIQTIRGFFGKK